MMQALGRLSVRDLAELAAALRSGRLRPPYPRITIERVVSGAVAESTAKVLESLADRGFTPDQAAHMLEMLREDRQGRPVMEDVLELVTTGPEMEGIANRDTGVVVRDLFANANESVLVAGYAVYQGHKVFESLANRMRDVPGLQVRLFLDIQRPRGDTSMASELINRFRRQFRTSQWPVDRPIPQVFFDPRSLELSAQLRASLHAKIVVVDSASVFISSANFTEAAQQRNVEIGIVAQSASLARRLNAFFETGLASGLFQPVLGQ